MTSVKLCGGIFVAIPTAIPEEPFINNVGIFEGKQLVLVVYHHSLA